MSESSDLGPWKYMHCPVGRSCWLQEKTPNGQERLPLAQGRMIAGISYVITEQQWSCQGSQHGRGLHFSDKFLALALWHLHVACTELRLFSPTSRALCLRGQRCKTEISDFSLTCPKSSSNSYLDTRLFHHFIALTLGGRGLCCLTSPLLHCRIARRRESSIGLRPEVCCVPC